MKKGSLLLSILLILSGINSMAQILSIDPIFPTQTDVVTVIYDASQGNGALVGVSPVYAHAGLITSASSSPTDWQYVQGNWGTADNSVLMEDLGDNLHRIIIDFPNFYGVPANEEVLEMAFVFRNADGSIVGRDTDGSDIFTPVYGNSGLFSQMIIPDAKFSFVSIGETVDINAIASEVADLDLSINGSSVNSVTNNSLIFSYTVVDNETEIIFTADNGQEVTHDTVYLIAPIVNNTGVMPANTPDGISYPDANTIRLKLYAPDKNYVFVTGDFNNWFIEIDQQMKVDGDYHFLDINNVIPGTEYAFQYYLEGDLRIADPYSTVVLDLWNDGWIDEDTYPDLPPVPAEAGFASVSLAFPGEAAFNWQHSDNFEKPEKADLVVYEMLMRDFFDEHNYQTLKDTLGYFVDLGVNAIELMPVNEFEGNNSWGYNPSFHMSLDKYYGTKTAFKEFIDAAHEVGIAIILDVVYNHAFSQSPLCQMYWNSAAFQPSADNPWLNQTPKHDFNVGYDFNHESPHTRNFVKNVVRYWLEEFKIDGYRFDLSKGFTQTNTIGNPSAMAAYDQSRIDILKDYADEVWSVDQDAFVILEHFATNSEETELQNYGMMLWGNNVHEFNEATMGYSSNLNGAHYSSRGWSEPNLVAYMESHDEERLMYKNKTYGNSQGTYNVKNINTGLQRCELGAVFFFGIPGAKMIWQFGELGYDVSINYDCRTCPKPIRWDYYDNFNRKRLYDTYKAMLHLKKERIADQNFDASLTGFHKYIRLLDLNNDANNENIVIVGNFGMSDASIDVSFPETGIWQEYFRQEDFNVLQSNTSLQMKAGEYRVYLKTPLSLPDNVDVLSIKDNFSFADFEIVPNPANDLINFDTDLMISEVDIYDTSGKLVSKVNESNIKQVVISELKSGIYFIRMTTDKGIISSSFVKE